MNVQIKDENAGIILHPESNVNVILDQDGKPIREKMDKLDHADFAQKESGSFNDLLTPGLYSAKGLSNAPPLNGGENYWGVLVVLSAPAGWGQSAAGKYLNQVATQIATNNIYTRWVRNYAPSSYGEWIKLPTMNDTVDSSKAGLMTAMQCNKLADIENKATCDAPYPELPLVIGTANMGNSDKFARGDHVHPRGAAATVTLRLTSYETVVMDEFCNIDMEISANTINIASFDYIEISGQILSNLEESNVSRKLKIEFTRSNIVVHTIETTDHSIITPILVSVNEADSIRVTLEGSWSGVELLENSILTIKQY